MINTRAIFLSALVLPAIADAAPLDTVLASLHSEAKRPVERTRLFIEQDGVADLYYIDRVSPGRLRILKNPRQGGFELIAIDSKQWLRSAPTKAWESSPMVAPAASLGKPSITGRLFRSGLTDAVETTRTDGGRTIEGRLSWTNGQQCVGNVLFRIGADGLPILLSFKGACGGKPAHFRQAFSFEGPVTIVPPA